MDETPENDTSDVPSSAEWHSTLTGDGKKTWNRMDKTEHVGYYRNYTEDYEGEDKFFVFRGDGSMKHCGDCSAGDNSHLIYPDDHIADAATEHEAALLVQNYCESVADEVVWQGLPPIHRRGGKHDRAKNFMI